MRVGDSWWESMTVDESLHDCWLSCNFIAIDFQTLSSTLNMLTIWMLASTYLLSDSSRLSSSYDSAYESIVQIWSLDSLIPWLQVGPWHVIRDAWTRVTCPTVSHMQVGVLFARSVCDRSRFSLAKSNRELHPVTRAHINILGLSVTCTGRERYSVPT